MFDHYERFDTWEIKQDSENHADTLHLKASGCGCVCSSSDFYILRSEVSAVHTTRQLNGALLLLGITLVVVWALELTNFGGGAAEYIVLFVAFVIFVYVAFTASRRYLVIVTPSVKYASSGFCMGESSDALVAWFTGGIQQPKNEEYSYRSSLMAMIKGPAPMSQPMAASIQSPQPGYNPPIDGNGYPPQQYPSKAQV